MELSENSQSISGWLQEYDQKTIQPIPKSINQQVEHKKKLPKRSVSLCQHRQDQEQYKSIRNSSQMPLPNYNMNKNNKIQELKRIMEFLQVNELSKYNAYHQYQQNPDIKEERQEIIQQPKVQFRIKLNCKLSSSNKQILQPLQEMNQINASTDRQQNCQTNNLKHRKTHLKTDHHQEFIKSSSIHRILSIKEVKPRMTKQLNEAQNKQKEFELLQLMIEKHKENVQQYLPKKNRYLR